MQSSLVDRIEELEASLQEKIRFYRGVSEEEEKERTPIESRISELRETLLGAVERVVANVSEQISLLTDPLSEFQSQIQQIQTRLWELKRYWKEEGLDAAGDWKDSLAEIGSLDLKIKAISPKRKTQISGSEILFFNQERVFQALRSAITVNQEAVQPEGEDFLLYEYGKYELDTGKHFQLRFDWPIPPGSAIFQTNRRLYVCGGEAEIGKTKVRLDELFEGDYEGRCRDLDKMAQRRDSLSLSGTTTLLQAVGGWNEKTLSVCERYSVNKNKWNSFPSLKEARQWPGSCVANQEKGFCFGGFEDSGKLVNSIEILETRERECEWRVVAFSFKVSPTSHLSAVEYMGHILVFGEAPQSRHKIYIFTEEGEMLEERSQGTIVSGQVSMGSSVVQRGKVYCIGERELKGKLEWRAFLYDGAIWSFL